MKKHYSQTLVNVLMVVTFALLMSCASKETKLETPTAETEAAKPASSFLSGKLDTLWVSSADFMKAPVEDLLLSYFFNRTDSSLTLHGWPKKMKAGKPQPYDTIPLLTLQKGRPGTGSFSADLYFTNLVLAKSDVKTIIDSLKAQNYAYVLFAPEEAFKTKYGSEIKYAIIFTNDDPGPTAAPKSIVTLATALYANPSPPKEN